MEENALEVTPLQKNTSRSVSLVAWFLSCVFLPLLVPFVFAYIAVYFVRPITKPELEWSHYGLFYALFVKNGVFVFFGTDLLSSLSEPLYWRSKRADVRAGEDWFSLMKQKSWWAPYVFAVCAFLIYLITAYIFIENLLTTQSAQHSNEVSAGLLVPEHAEGDIFIHVFAFSIALILALYAKAQRNRTELEDSTRRATSWLNNSDPM